MDENESNMWVISTNTGQAQILETKTTESKDVLFRHLGDERHGLAHWSRQIT
jgi:hypothetical protein